MWSARDQKVAKQREGCTLHSDTWKCTLLLRQPLITLWLLDYIQNLAFSGDGVPGSDTVLLKLTALLLQSFFKRSGVKRDKKTKLLSHKLLTLCCQTPATFLPYDALNWPWHPSPLPDRSACEARDASPVSLADLSWRRLGMCWELGVEISERLFAEYLQRWHVQLVLFPSCNKDCWQTRVTFSDDTGITKQQVPISHI